MLCEMPYVKGILSHRISLWGTSDHTLYTLDCPFYKPATGLKHKHALPMAATQMKPQILYIHCCTGSSCCAHPSTGNNICKSTVCRDKQGITKHQLNCI